MAIEDAVVLGKLFSFLSSYEQIPNFLHAFEEIRQERVKSVRVREESNAAFVRMPPGPEQDARNSHFRMARNEWDDGALKSEFEGLAELFGYDAYDAAAVSLAVDVRPSAALTIRRTGMVGRMGSVPGPQVRRTSP